LLDKAQKTALIRKNYKDTNLSYQASFEFDFLEKYYETFKNEIVKGPRIIYFIDNELPLN
jgi:hypothetical protein